MKRPLPPSKVISSTAGDGPLPMRPKTADTKRVPCDPATKKTYPPGKWS